MARNSSDVDVCTMQKMILLDVDSIVTLKAILKFVFDLRFSFLGKSAMRLI